MRQTFRLIVFSIRPKRIFWISAEIEISVHFAEILAEISTEKYYLKNLLNHVIIMLGYSE